MHHRLRRCNYGIHSSLCDRVFGTWKDFKPLDEPPPEPPKPKMWYELSRDPAEVEPEPPSFLAKAGRPELLPSPWSVGATMGLFLCTTLFVELCVARALP